MLHVYDTVLLAIIIVELYLIVEKFPLKNFFPIECPHFMDLMTDLPSMNDNKLTQCLGKL